MWAAVKSRSVGSGGEVDGVVVVADHPRPGRQRDGCARVAPVDGDGFRVHGAGVGNRPGQGEPFSGGAVVVIAAGLVVAHADGGEGQGGWCAADPALMVVVARLALGVGSGELDLEGAGGLPGVGGRLAGHRVGVGGAEVGPADAGQPAAALGKLKAPLVGECADRVAGSEVVGGEAHGAGREGVAGGHRRGAGGRLVGLQPSRVVLPVGPDISDLRLVPAGPLGLTGVGVDAALTLGHAGEQVFPVRGPDQPDMMGGVVPIGVVQAQCLSLRGPLGPRR